MKKLLSLLLIFFSTVSLGYAMEEDERLASQNAVGLPRADSRPPLPGTQTSTTAEWGSQLMSQPTVILAQDPPQLPRASSPPSLPATQTSTTANWGSRITRNGTFILSQDDNPEDNGTPTTVHLSQVGIDFAEGERADDASQTSTQPTLMLSPRSFIEDPRGSSFPSQPETFVAKPPSQPGPSH